MTCVAAQLRAQQRAQAVRIPLGLRDQRAPVFVLEVAQPGAQVGGDRRELGVGPRPAAPGLRRAAAPRTPATQPRQLSCATTIVISAIARPSPAMKHDQVAPRVLAAPVDEAQVVQQHQDRRSAPSSPTTGCTPT